MKVLSDECKVGSDNAFLSYFNIINPIISMIIIFIKIVK